MIYSDNEREVVRILKKSKPLRANEILNKLQRKQTVESTLRRLKEKDIVKSSKSPYSMREVLWELTEKHKNWT